MGVEAAAVGPWTGWGTWEELILGGAVLRHGTEDWNVVASELQARSLYPHSFTPEVCKAKYEDLRKRYSGSGSKAWFEELRKQRMEELKRELARSEDSIGSLESKIKSLEAEKQNSNQADYGSSQTESPSPALNSDGMESSGKEVSKDENSAGSFTKDTRTMMIWLCDRREMEMDTKPDVSVSSEQDKDLSINKLAGAGYGQGVTIKKRRGQRKRKDCSRAVEGSLGDSDYLGSSNVVSTAQKEASATDRNQTIQETAVNNHNEAADAAKRRSIMEIFQSVAQSEPAVVFRHRLDSQKRARYRKVIRQHVDFGTIRSRIIGKSIRTAKELFRDLLLLANNALVFYSRRTREYKSALSLRNLVRKEYKQQHCRGSYYEILLAFPPFNPPVKPRSARPRPRPQPCEDGLSQKLSNAEKVLPAKNTDSLEKPCDSDNNVSLNSLLKAKRGLNRRAKVRTESADARPKTSPVKPRKRV